MCFLQDMIIYWKAVGPGRFKFFAIENFCVDYFYKCDAESMDYNALRAKHIDSLLKHMLIVLPLMTISHVIVIGAPIHALLFEHTRTTPVGLHLPILEKDSDLEFTLNMTLQAILTFYALVGSVAIEIASCMINNTIKLVPHLFRFSLHEFRHELKTSGMSIIAIAQLRNIFIQIQDYNRFDFRKLMRIYNWRLTFIIFQVYIGCDRCLQHKIINLPICMVYFDHHIDFCRSCGKLSLLLDSRAFNQINEIKFAASKFG